MESVLEKYCSKEWIEFANFHKKTLSVKKGEPIFKIGEKTEGLFFINTGFVKITLSKQDNEERIVRLASEGDVLGHRGFGGNWKYPISAIALTDCELSFMSISIFNQIAKANADLSYALMMFFAEELRDSESFSLSTPVLNRIAKTIYANYTCFGADKKTNKLNFTLSRVDISKMAQTTYESTIRAITDLNKLNIIKTVGKEFIILNNTELKKLSL